MPTITEIDVVRAWKDETYYESLSETEKALLPPNPAGKFDPTFDLKSLIDPPSAQMPTTTVTVTTGPLHSLGECPAP